MLVIHIILVTPSIMEGPEDVEVSWGGTAVFHCRVEGDPVPAVVWMHDDQEIPMDGSKYKLMDDGSLMIQDTQDTDNGYYECMAKNIDGEIKSRPARMIVTLNEPNDESNTFNFVK